MNHIHRLHGHLQSDSHEIENRAPFWVRHYDLVVNLVTLGRTRAVHKQTLALVELNPGDAVLDVGCGTGALALEVERAAVPGGTIVGVDVEPAMIEQAQRRADKDQSGVHFEIASIEQIPYADETFDLAFSTLMYHHLTDAQRDAGFYEVRRVLKPGGRFILVDINPSKRSILTSLPGHSRLAAEDYVRKEVIARMEETGFTVIDDGEHPSRQLSYAIGCKV